MALWLNQWYSRQLILETIQIMNYFLIEISLIRNFHRRELSLHAKFLSLYIYVSDLLNPDISLFRKCISNATNFGHISLASIF